MPVTFMLVAFDLMTSMLCSYLQLFALPTTSYPTDPFDTAAVH